MEKFSTVTSVIVPLPRHDVDTDLIIPAQYLTAVSKEGFGRALFKRLRDSDPAFPLNDERYRGARILVTGENFGCGSSREHAVWALREAGFRVVIAKSFADIFRSNSGKNGLLLVTLPGPIVDDLLARAAVEDVRVTVDLESQIVAPENGEPLRFEYDPFRRHCLLQGLDDLDYIRSHQADIDRFRSAQEANRFIRL